MATAGEMRRTGTIIFDDLAFKLTPAERIIFGIIHRYSKYQLGECRLKPHSIIEIAGVSRSTFYNVVNRLRDLGLIQVVQHAKASGASFTAYRVVRDTVAGDKLSGIEIESQEKENMTPIPSGEMMYFDEAMDLSDDHIDLLAASIESASTRPSEARRYGSSEVNALFDYWFEHTGIAIDTSKRNRQAAWNLLKKQGPDSMRRAIKLVGVAKYNETAPRISNFIELQSKWYALHLWAEKRANAALLREYESLSLEQRAEFRTRNPDLTNIIKNMREAK